MQRRQRVLDDFLPFLPRFLVPVRIIDATPLSTLLLARDGVVDLPAPRAGPNLVHGDWS